jgi:hypothetical protein
MIKLLRDELISIQTTNKSIIDNVMDKNKITDVILLISKSINDMKNSNDKRIFFDIMIMKIYELLKRETQTNVCVKKEEITVEKTNEKNKEEPIVNDKAEENLDYSIFEKLMDIRLNNILSLANKSALLECKQKIKELSSDILNLDQLRIANILSDFDVKAASENGIVLTTTTQNILNTIYDELIEADTILSESMNRNIKICVLLDDTWNNKREIYVQKIKNKEKIDQIDETDLVDRIKKIKNKEESSEFDDLLEIGGN